MCFKSQELSRGYSFCRLGNSEQRTFEKLTVYSEKCGYSGDMLADILRRHRIECEYSDCGCVVLMCSPYNDEKDFFELENAFREIPVLAEKAVCNKDKIPEG